MPNDIEHWKRKIRRIYFYMCSKDGVQLARIAKIHFYTRYDEYRSNPLWDQYRYEDYKFCYEFFDKYMVNE